MSYARIWREINSDADFTALSFDAQAFYVRIALVEPSVNKCGVGDWRPSRLTVRAPDLTVDRIMAAAYELEQAGYLLFDLATEEYLIRSLIRREEIIRNPKASVTLVENYAAVYSPILRAAIVSEVQRERKENPNYSGWTSTAADRLTRILESKNLETVGYEPQITRPVGVPDTPPFGVPDTQPDTPPFGVPETDPIGQTVGDRLGDQNPIVYPSVSPEPKPKPEPFQGVRMPTDVQTAPANQPNDPPPPTCPRHPSGTDDPCSACRRARQTRARYDAQRLDAEQRAARAEAEATSRAAHERAELQAAETAQCQLCDQAGYLLGDDPDTPTGVCNHDPAQADTNRRGIDAVRAALARKAYGGDTPPDQPKPNQSDDDPTQTG